MFSLGLSLTLTLSLLASPAHAQRGHGVLRAAPPVAPRQPTILRLTYVQGQSARYVTHAVQTAPAPIGETHTTGHVQIDTVAVRPDGSAALRMRITGMEVQGANVTDAARQQIQRGVAGMTMNYTQDARGRITDRQAPSGIAPEFRPLVEGVLQSLDQMSPQMPEGPVSIGDHWADHRTMHLSLGPSMAIDMDINVTYTLAAVTPGQAASINFQMTMGMAHGVQMQGASVTGQGAATGNMAMDLAHGVLVSSHSAGDMNMHLVGANGRAADVHTTYANDMAREGAGAAGPAIAPAH